MMIEYPGTPKRPGWICWQIRYERQPDGSLKKRHEYVTAPRPGQDLPVIEPDPEPTEPAPAVRRGVARTPERTLL